MTASTDSTPWSHRNRTKEQLRQRIWTQLQERNAVHRAPLGHIPHFIGAELAAERLAQEQIWQQAQVIKCNPDSPQAPVRLQALADGKQLYMAVPKLAEEKCFVAITAAMLNAQDIPLSKGASMAGALQHGQRVSFTEMQPIDLVLVGCVAVTSTGGRTGKGAGFADLELAMLSEYGLITPQTPIATTVHSLQMVEPSALAMQSHDWPLDWICTPEQTITTQTSYAQPTGLDWSQIQPDQLRDIPILQRLQGQRLKSVSLD